MDVLDRPKKRVRQHCGDQVVYVIRKHDNVALDVLPVTRTRRRLVINSELRDIAKGGLESDQPLLERREAVEFFGITMLASYIHVVDGACLWQLPTVEATAAFEANIDLSVTCQWQTLLALLKSHCGS